MAFRDVVTPKRTAYGVLAAAALAVGGWALDAYTNVTDKAWDLFKNRSFMAETYEIEVDGLEVTYKEGTNSLFGDGKENTMEVEVGEDYSGDKNLKGMRFTIVDRDGNPVLGHQLPDQTIDRVVRYSPNGDETVADLEDLSDGAEGVLEKNLVGKVENNIYNPVLTAIRSRELAEINDAIDSAPSVEGKPVQTYSPAKAPE